MQYTSKKMPLAKLLAFTSVFLMAFTHSAVAGLDRYEIYLNNKLIMSQAVNVPLSLESLQLGASNANDKIIIYYTQCNAPDNKLGKSRKIMVTDAAGVLIKEWKFADAQGSNTGMVIPVKELLLLEKKHAGLPLSLLYAAEGHATGQKLTMLQIGTQRTTYTDETGAGKKTAVTH